MLVTGGEDNWPNGIHASVELFDPSTNTFTLHWRNLNTTRASHTATLLANGDVLITGGVGGPSNSTLASADVYESPSGFIWSTASNMTVARVRHRALLTKLPGGQAMVIGGAGPGFQHWTNVDLYDPATRTFQATAPLQTGRYWHTNTLLNDGTVLVVGGNVVSSVERSTTTRCNPEIRYVWPSSGPVGTEVEIDFIWVGNPGTTSVTFNGTPAQHAVDWNGTVYATVPAGATSGPVILTINGRSSNGVNFTVLSSADLTITKTDGPDPVGVGGNLTYTLTVQNSGPAGASGVTVTDTLPASVTFISANSTQGTCSHAAGTVTCNVGSLANGASATITIVVRPNAIATISNTASVSGNEPDPNTGNNSAAANTQVLAAGIDLVIAGMGQPPGTLAIGSSFITGDAVHNQGAVAAGTSTTRFYLSLDRVFNTGDRLFSAQRVVPALGPSQTHKGETTLVVRTGTPDGDYYLLACADDRRQVAESNETNNCLASPKPSQLRSPDLVIDAVQNPPAQASLGSSFSASDVTRNAGAGNAAVSTNRYYLSLDTVGPQGDVRLTGSQAVPALLAGQGAKGSATVTIPAMAPGTYYLLSCADDLKVVPETVETNNCRASTSTIVVGAADLVVTSVSNPPASGAYGSSFSVSDTTLNQGSADAGASTTRYYVSVDTLRNGGDRLLSGSRPVPLLQPGISSIGMATVTIPTMPVGTYYVLACADDTGVVLENVQTNNCRASASTMVVRGPDLVVTSVSNPPASAALASSFTISDTTLNQGSADAAASTTRYYLSLDTLRNSGDRLLTGSRPVPLLQPGISSNGMATATVPSNTPLATYYVLACADDLRRVAENNEANNCLATATQVRITP